MGPKNMFLLIFCISIEINFASRFPAPPNSPNVIGKNFALKLGEEIQAKLKERLAPLSETLKNLEIRTGMMNGIGGVTVAVYGGKHKVMIKDGTVYSCHGDILENKDKTSVYCTKPLSREFTKEEDICFLRSSYSQSNNEFCFGNNVSFNCINNVCTCIGGTKYSLSDLKKMCGDTFKTNEYVTHSYYPDKANKKHIEVPNAICEQGGKNVCIFGKPH